MKNIYQSLHIILSSTALLFVTCEAKPVTTVPDLTLKEEAEKVNRTQSTYNLGPTGLRGYIHVSRRANDGRDGTMTGESRQILITVASAPADKVLQVDDVILGVAWGRSGIAVKPFNFDARKEFGNAINEAEKDTNGGILRVKRWRAGESQDVVIQLPIMGTYSNSMPYNCEKSANILKDARNHFVGKLLANPQFLQQGHPWARPVHALALLSAVRPEDPDYAAVQSRIQAFARSISQPRFSTDDGCMWTFGQEGIFLAEYYLATADQEVLPGLVAYSDKIAKSMSVLGTCNHRPALPRNDGTDRRSVRGYGAVNSSAIPANLALVLLKKALKSAQYDISPEHELSIHRGANFFAWFVNKGGIPYGEHLPWLSGHSSNGKNSSAAVFFSQLDDRLAETEYYTRWSIAASNSREYGHTGQGLSYQWEGIAANIGGPAAVAAYFQPIQWHLALSRRGDGSFAYDGQEQYGGGSTLDGTYLGKSSYYDLEATAIYLLTYSLPYKRLHISGKNANPAHRLSAEKIKNATDAGQHILNRHNYTVTQLLKHLCEYDPVVRISAAEELATRKLNQSELNALRNMLSSKNPNERRSACEALSLLKDTESVTRITEMLDQSKEPDLWVRAGVATALRNYGDMAKNSVPAMLQAVVKNAQDPDQIDWAQPTQASNGELTFSLFGSMPGSRYYTFNHAVSQSDKDLRIAATRTGIQHPDSAVRSIVAGYLFQKVPVDEILLLPNELIKLALNDSQCDRMWSDPSRQAGMRTLAKHKFFEFMPTAVRMAVPTQEFWHNSTSESAIKELAEYGEAARWTIPALRNALTQWDEKTSQHQALLKTIETIDAATTAPELRYLNVHAETQILSTPRDKELPITLTGQSPRNASIRYVKITKPEHGTLTGSPPTLTYTPKPGYSGPDQFSFQVTDDLTTSAPIAIGIVVGAVGTGLRGDYFSSEHFTDTILTRLDPQIHFTATDKQATNFIPTSAKSVRWSGFLLIPETTTYTFSALHSDGIGMYLDGVAIIEDKNSHPLKWIDSNPTLLKKGQMIKIEIGYRNTSGNATAKLKWLGAKITGLTGDFIPQAYLFDKER